MVAAMPHHTRARRDPVAAKRDLGYRYTVPIAEGMRRIYEGHVERGSLENSDDDSYVDRILAAWSRLSEAMRCELEGLDE